MPFKRPRMEGMLHAPQPPLHGICMLAGKHADAAHRPTVQLKPGSAETRLTPKAGIEVCKQANGAYWGTGLLAQG